LELVEREERRNGLGEEATRHRLLEAFFNARAEAHAQSRKASELEQLRRELEQQLKALDRKLGKKESLPEQPQPRKVKKLQEQLHNKARQLGQLQDRLVTERRKASSLERQLASIRGSKSWRLLDRLKRAKESILKRR
jgi:hypothetical protein